MTMLDDFSTRALIAGLGIAAVCGPLGCFIVWRRLAYFGDTIAHAGLLGVGVSIILGVNLTVGVFCIAALVALSLFALEKRTALSGDALLGILSHGSLALGLTMIALLTWVRVDVMGILLGDILIVTKTDIFVIYGSGALVLLCLALIWRPLFASVVSPDIARAEGIDAGRYQLALVLLLACVIAIAIKIVGVLLITALLIIPAATARRFASGPEVMALIAVSLGMVSVSGGLYGSFQWNTPAGPSIVVTALLIFLVSLMRVPFAVRFGRLGSENE